ncbi:MAG TPA: histidine kinase [Chitinophagaceae bacterium]|jgi:LytS/YehU family sensor histidine kinase|nr:histidine kinase [Chitinophagaceae bacterium]
MFELIDFAGPGLFFFRLAGRQVLNAFLIYSNILILIPFFLQKKKKITFAVFLVLSILLYSLGAMGLDILCYRELFYNKYYHFNFLNALVDNFSWGIFLTFISTLLKISLDWLDQQQKMKETMITGLKSELNFLKAQINPHFLFNTLNNLFSIAQKKNNTELATGISKLSGLMRYMLHESNSEMVPVEKEIRYLKDYIEVCRLRIDESDNALIRFSVNGDLHGIEIAPMLLIPFVENAFKYGINFKERSEINIRIYSENDLLRFEIENTNHSYIHRTFDKRSGIGLNNVRKRLDLIYGENYTLDIDPGTDIFSVSLAIKPF